MKKNEFKCAGCKKIYEKGWTKEEQKEEFEKHFKREINKTDKIVCDNCYKKIIKVNEN